MELDDARMDVAQQQEEHERYSRMMNNFDPGDYLIDEDDEEDYGGPYLFWMLKKTA